MRYVVSALLAASCATGAKAQRAEENAVTTAQDAFGTSVGTERIGLYSEREIRGFNPVTAGNVRFEGTYVDLQGSANDRLVKNSTIRIGLAALEYPFPAPTGIVDYRLRIPSDERSVSVVARAGSFGAAGFDIDAAIPLIDDKLSVGIGTSYGNDVFKPGLDRHSGEFAIIGNWHPHANFKVTPFYAWKHALDGAEPTIYVSGPFLPPTLSNDFYGQTWANEERIEEAFGTIGQANLTSSLTLKAGIFHTSREKLNSYSDLFKSVSPSGLADHSIVSNPRQRQASTSGELQFARRFGGSLLSQSLHVVARWRKADSLYGGSSSVNLGKTIIGERNPVARPRFNYGVQATDEVSQFTGGIGYEVALPGKAEISLGLQRTHYSKIVKRPDGQSIGITSSPWLYNGLFAVFLTRHFTVYASYTKGLEENGTAPSISTNDGEPLPAAITSQREAGFRYALRPNFILVAGYFDLRKPYFTLDPTNLYTKLGALSTTGYEVSISGPVIDGLSLVAGAAIMNPKVTGQAVGLGLVGEYPVGQTRHLVRVNLDYRPPTMDAFSFDLGIVYTGKEAASVRANSVTGEQVFVSARTAIDVGTRYRFQLMNTSATLRLQVRNITNSVGWMPTSSGGFRLHGPRRLTVQLALDL